MTNFFSWVGRMVVLCLLLVPSMAWAHSEQTEASQVEMAARRDYLSLKITGAGLDLRDAVAKDEGARGHSSTESSASALLQRLAARYVESHLFFEQNGQVLTVKAGAVRFWGFSPSDPSSEQFEVYARAERPAKVAQTPLSVSSTLFRSLEKAATIVYLGGESRVVRGVKVAEFALKLSVPTVGGDLVNFAWNGALHPLSSPDHLLFLAALFLAASVLPLRRLVVALAGFTLAHGVAFALGVEGHLAFSPSLALMGTTISIIAVAGLSWWQARQEERGGTFAAGAPLLVVLATVGGLLHGFSGAAPLQVWGLPETSLALCVAAWTVGVALSQIAMTLVVWPLLLHVHRRFVHNAQYGGTTWPRALQVASLACMVGGGWWFVQSDAGLGAPPAAANANVGAKK